MFLSEGFIRGNICPVSSQSVYADTAQTRMMDTIDNICEFQGSWNWLEALTEAEPFSLPDEPSNSKHSMQMIWSPYFSSQICFDFSEDEALKIAGILRFNSERTALPYEDSSEKKISCP